MTNQPTKATFAQYINTGECLEWRVKQKRYRVHRMTPDLYEITDLQPDQHRRFARVDDRSMAMLIKKPEKVEDLIWI
jgi:hypothetical protein